MTTLLSSTNGEFAARWPLQHCSQTTCEAHDLSSGTNLTGDKPKPMSKACITSELQRERAWHAMDFAARTFKARHQIVDDVPAAHDSKDLSEFVGQLSLQEMQRRVVEAMAKHKRDIETAGHWPLAFFCAVLPNSCISRVISIRSVVSTGRFLRAGLTWGCLAP